MKVRVTSLLGLGGIPKDRTSAKRWLEKASIVTRKVHGDGRRIEVVWLTDLPAPVRVDYIARECERSGLSAGTFDEAAHAELASCPPSMRAEAERKASIARLVLTAGKALTWSERVALATAKFGAEGTSEPSLMRILRRVEGVDPINFAPALVDRYAGGRAKTEISAEAWSFFLTSIRDAAETFPLISAWRDVRDLKAKNGWQWPSYPTVFRRWQALPEAERLHARIGRADALKRLSQPIMRDKESIGPLEWVSLDGRTLDFWVDFGDGRAVRPVMLALVDVATNLVLDYELARSENAPSTVRLIKRVCQTYGIFDRLYTDNGSAFAGHLVAGGAVHRFRNSGRKVEGVKPLGICHHLGIDLRFALPTNAQAKIAERAFASLSRVLDDRPEFKGAHAGHAPGASPNDKVSPVPFDLAMAVIRREVARHNSERGRRAQGMAGRSYQEVFEAGLALRIRRQPTARQLYLAGLIYKPVSVDRWGRVTVLGWTYGGPETQEDLLPYHRRGEAILLGRDPDDFEAPALAWNADDRLICEGIQPVKRGRYGSVDGVREAARNRKAARDAVAAAAEANAYLDAARFSELLASIPDPGPIAPAPVAVVAGRFNAPLKAVRVSEEEAAERRSGVPEEYLRNLDDHIAERAAGRR